ncbi:hypothetical protein [Streptomyces somaliensis]|uniref:hypothetical protein n=1 Tax=Streptomyces somaliensis TaxID=78355 RepID=UPI00263BA4C8|nr:hypothetical protein [Streptomyces somaliensis]
MTAPHPLTVRPPVRLPPMSTEDEARAHHPALALRRARIDGDGLVFDGPGDFDAALAQGFFLLRVPDGVDCAPDDRFATHFHLDQDAGGAPDPYRGYRHADVPGAYQGYFDREHDQWENLYVERANWDLLPGEVAALGARMAGTGLTVLRAVLDHAGVPRATWDTVTAGLTADRGHQMLAFNHFRADKPTRGSKFHRDSGWVTVLRSVEPGLLALVDGTLGAVNPEPGHFIVNFGSSLEVLRTPAHPGPGQRPRRRLHTPRPRPSRPLLLRHLPRLRPRRRHPPHGGRDPPPPAVRRRLRRPGGGPHLRRLRSPLKPWARSPRTHDRSRAR